MLRIKLLRELAKGVRKHLYALATELHEHFSTIHNVLEDFKKAGIVEVEATGPRGTVYYRLTPLGKRVLELLDWVETQGSVEPIELKKTFGENMVNVALTANLLESRVEKIKLVKLIPDAPLGISKESSWMKCTKCGGYVNITGRPSHALCTNCGQVYKLSDINWLDVILRGFWGAVKFGALGFLCGAAVGYLADEKDRGKGAETGAKAGGASAAILGAIEEAWKAYEYEQKLSDYVPVPIVNSL